MRRAPYLSGAAISQDQGVPPLPVEPLAIWVRYVSEEHKSVRKLALASLNEFLIHFERLPEPKRFEWAWALLEPEGATARSIPLRMPVFEKIIFPALAAGHSMRDVKSTRWLARLYPKFGHAESCWGQLGCANELELWKAILRVDPQDEEARSQIIEWTVDYIRHTLHELPAGVLYGMNGATEPECSDLLEMTKELRALAGPSLPPWLTLLLETAEHHYATYRDYLRDRRPMPYDQYCSRRPPP